jgi:hypothetical protein
MRRKKVKLSVCRFILIELDFVCEDVAERRIATPLRDTLLQRIEQIVIELSNISNIQKNL